MQIDNNVIFGNIILQYLLNNAHLQCNLHISNHLTKQLKVFTLYIFALINHQGIIIQLGVDILREIQNLTTF